MTTEKPPRAPHRDLFLDNSDKVNRLLEIHTALTGTGPGYKHNVEVLNKSAIVLLVATGNHMLKNLRPIALIIF